MDYSPFGKDGKIEVAAPIPYPPLEVDGPNSQYARLLGMDMASSKSELTSISQYLYHSWVLPADYDYVHDLMRRIAEVEMHHFDMLGQLIVKLGGNPRFMTVTNRPLMWNGSMVAYNRTPAMAVKDDLLLEQAAINTYRRQAAAIRDPYVTAVLRRIIQDEEMHLDIFKTLLAQVSAGGKNT